MVGAEATEKVSKPACGGLTSQAGRAISQRVPLYASPLRANCFCHTTGVSTTGEQECTKCCSEPTGSS